MKTAAMVWWCTLLGFSLTRVAHADALEECLATHEDAQANWRAAHFLAAKEGLIKCVASCPGEIALDCSTLLQRVESNTPTAVAVATDANGADVKLAKVTIDDHLVLEQLDGLSVPLDPGEHHFRIEWPSGESAEQTVVLSEGEKNRRVVFAQAPKPEERPSSTPQQHAAPPHPDARRTAAYVLAAASAGFLATFAIFAISGKQKENEVDRCKPYCLQSQADAMHSRYLIGDLSLGLTLATGGVASYLFFSSSHSATSVNGTSAFRAPDQFAVGIRHAF